MGLPSVHPGAFERTGLLTGNLQVASYMTDEGQSGTTTTEDGFDFFVRTSTDVGLTWVSPKLIGGGAHFPGLLTLDSTTFMALWTSDALSGSLVNQQYTVS